MRQRSKVIQSIAWWMRFVVAVDNTPRDGQGTYTLPDGRTYVGEWKDGKYNGQGTRLYPARSTYFTAFLRLLDTCREKADGMEMGTGLIIIWAILILVCLI